MSKDKLTIWLLGSNATGKSTQAALIHLLMRKLIKAEDYQSKFCEFQEDGIKYSYTKVSPISANLGIFNHPLTSKEGEKTNACCGTDRLSTKEQIYRAYLAALNDPDIKIITVDAIMATGQFINFLNNSESRLLTVLLDCTENTNFKRLAARRGAKLGIDPSEVELSERTRENLSTKLRNFRSTFSRTKDQADNSLSISTDDFDISQVNSLIVDSILCSI